MDIHYKIEGSSGSPVIVLSNSLGASLEMWDRVVPLLMPYFRVLRYDTRGLGKSLVGSEPYSIDLLGRDVLNLMDHLDLNRVIFCGLSMGGLIGQWLGIHHPDRLHDLILCNTAARIGDKESWNNRIELISRSGLSEVWKGTRAVWFSESFRDLHPDLMEFFNSMFTGNSAEGYQGCCTAIASADFRALCEQIPVRTLVLTGAKDPVTTVEDARFLVEQIPDSFLEVMEGQHLCSIEYPDSFVSALIDFLIGDTAFDRGMHLRSAVLGKSYVKKANASINEFNGDFQSFITEYAWGSIWNRPGISKRDRSLVTLGMLIALNKPQEFQMHVRAALANNVPVSEIKEVLMHSALYCGLPAANEAFRLAQEVLQELDLST